MANLNCYTCNGRFASRTMARIDGEDNAAKLQIAINRRNALNLPPLEVGDRTRLCFNCNISVREEIEAVEQDPNCLRLNVLTQTQNNTCLICNAALNLHYLSMECKANVFISTNIFIPEFVKSCSDHLDDRGYLLPHLFPGLRYVYRPYQLKGQQLQMFLQSLREIASSRARIVDEHSFTDEEFKIFFSVTKEQFLELFDYCDAVPCGNGRHRYIYKKDLLIFLCKLRQGLSDEFLTSMFQYSSRQATSMAVSTVRQSLLLRFVPENIGFGAITREDYINQHVTDFSNQLYNPEPAIPRVIAIIDGTYSFVHKSSDFRALRQSYSVHKGEHLVKPHLIVAPNGYILQVQGPYFADSRNNDAAILRNEFGNDAAQMRHWFQEDDIILVDRGYRDATELLQQLGISWKMPAFLERGEHQLSTEDSNASRMVTIQRWIVEARNGHFKSIFKFFANVVQIQYVPHIGDYYRIAGAIINKYHPPLIMNHANRELANEILEKAKEANVVQALVEEQNLRNRIGQRWIRLDAVQLNDFPVLTLDDLKQFTYGTYQIKLAPSYVQDKLRRDDDEQFEIEMSRDENRLPLPGFLRVRVYSRFRAATKYQLWIAYIPTDEEEGDQLEADLNPIQGYYCTCKSGTRTIGCCAHITSVVWYLSYARHDENVKYPCTRFIQSIQDAGNRPQ